MASWEKFDKYYSMTDNSPLYAAALVLHPNCRTKYIESNWRPKWQKSALAKVRKLWITHYRNRVPPFQAHTASYDKNQKTVDGPLDAFDQIKRDLMSYTRPASQDEYEDYISLPPLDIGTQSALFWWSQEPQRTRWPKLSYMAIDVLSIPAMSAEAERIFSGARRTISWDRAQLTPTNIEHTECVKHWELSGIAKDPI